MKKSILTLILFCSCLAGFAQEPIEVMVLMKDQYNRTELHRKAEFFPTRAERRDFVVKELQTFTKASQYDLMLTLNALEQQGLVSSIHSLWSANALYFTTTEDIMQALAERPDIASITPVKQYPCIIPESTTRLDYQVLYDYIAPNIRQVNADQVWEQGYRGQGVVVAVIDTGVNYRHADIADHLWDGGEEFPHHGFDVFNLDDDPMDDNGHGTHCAGTVCGDGTAWMATGVAPEATLMCIKSAGEEGNSGAAYIVKGMEWAVEHGSDLISLSLGVAKAEVADKELLRLACNALLDVGIVVIAAAGNEGSETMQNICPIPNNVRVPGACPPPYLDPDQMENPGGLSCVICVGAVDENDTTANFTSRGPVTWQHTEFGDYAYKPGIGLIRPDVCAPGMMIWSLDYENLYDYDYMSGTSQATPCVAGIVALMLNKNPELTPAQICQILEETSVRLTPTKSNLTGVGRVDALAAVNAVTEWDAVDESIDINQDAFDTATQRVYDLTGRLVNTNYLAPGIYIIQDLKGDKAKTKKIVIR